MANASSPINPHFLQPLLPGFHNHINIPIAFYSKYMKRTTNENNVNTVVELRSDASDLTWEVKLDGQRLTQGWQEFATSHGLQVGDIVIFRHDGDLVFHVTPFYPSFCDIQYNDYDDDIKISSDSKKYRQQHKREAGSSSDHSCFVARVTESNLRKDALFLPVHFSRSNGLVNREGEIILLNEDGKPWTLFLKYYQTQGCVYIRHGWRSFCRANRKRAHDVMTFKLVQRGSRPVLQLRSTVYKRASPSPTSLDRFLTLTLTPYHLKSYKLCLPVPFVVANGIKNVSKIILVDRFGVQITTSLKPDDKYGRMRLGKGWRKFCEDNGVKAGESFRLEHIKEEDTGNHLLKFCYTVIYSL